MVLFVSQQLPSLGRCHKIQSWNDNRRRPVLSLDDRALPKRAAQQAHFARCRRYGSRQAVCWLCLYVCGCRFVKSKRRFLNRHRSNRKKIQKRAIYNDLEEEKKTNAHNETLTTVSRKKPIYIYIHYSCCLVLTRTIRLCTIINAVFLTIARCILGCNQFAIGHTILYAILLGLNRFNRKNE
jgi:hypothetical protein